MRIHHPDLDRTVDLPDGAARSLCRRRGWVPVDDDAPAAPAVKRPAGNASTEAWAAYADHLGVDLPDGASRDEIRDVVDATEI